MTCIANSDRKAAELVLDYCSGSLDPEQSAAIDEHLRECARCRELVAAQSSVWQALDAWKPIEVSPDFDARLSVRISQEPVAPWWYGLSQRLFPAPVSLWKPALSVAGVGALAVLLFAVHPAATVVPSGQPSAPTQQEAEKVEVQPRIDMQEVRQALDDLDLITPAGATVQSPL